VIKENTVTVFGELGSVFQKGSDYDEEVDLTVPYMELSNLIMYFTGTVADGTVGSSVEGSLRNLNAPVSNVRKFIGFTNVDHATEANHYYIGDIVLFDPITGNGTSVNASCWTCIKTTSDLLSPIPELANEIATASALGGSATSGATYNTNYGGVAGKSGPGMTGIDNRGQRFIVGVLPAIYDPLTSDITTSPYWRESALAKSYQTAGNYYQGELVVFNGGVYQCRSTNGFLADPQLYQRVRYTALQEQNDAAGITNASPEDLIAPYDPALAPNGAFGYDSSGTRYIMAVPPTGGIFSALYWEPATLPKVPNGAYLNINWDNTSITDKIQFYDTNIVGGSGAQAIASFEDDFDNTITTLRKIYDDNEKSFQLTIANQILASIPAAAIKAQAVNPKVEPDNTLLELVHLGPSNSKPSQYTPAVQGLFEESIARDMLRISGYSNTITEIVMTDGSRGYTSVPNVQIVGGLATNPRLVPFAAAASANLGITSIKIDKSNSLWTSVNSGKRYGVGDLLTFVPQVGQGGTTVNPTIPCEAKVYRVDSLGNILAILITNKGSGFRARPTVSIGGIPVPFLEPVLEVVGVDLQYRDSGFSNDMRVVVLYGSGAGAVGYAETSSIVSGSGTAVTRLTGVKFVDLATPGLHTDGQGNLFSLSTGANYVSGNFKKDIVALQGYATVGGIFQPVLGARAIGVVTSIIAGRINSLVVINNGSGYVSNPPVIIEAPAVDLRENASLASTTLTSFLPVIDNQGIYTENTLPTFTIAEIPTNATASNVQGRAYLGLNAADVKFGGSGFSVGEYMSVSGGGPIPAQFSVSYNTSTSTYSALVMEGGSGYEFDTDEGFKNEIILNDDIISPTGTIIKRDQLRAEITSVGGAISEVSFNYGRPTGEGFEIDDIIEVTPTTANYNGTPFRFKVTSVGLEGTIPSDGYEVVTETTVSGFEAGQTLLAKSKFLSIDSLSITTPREYTSPNQPVVVIEPPTGTITLSGTSTWTNIPAETSVSMKVSTIAITNGGTGYQLGDIITIEQPGARSCEAFVLALANTVTGSVGVIAIQNAGSGFDLSKTGADSIVINLPTTTGTPLVINVLYRVDKIVITNPGVGYVAAPVATISDGGGGAGTLPLTVTTKNAGGSTASFLAADVDAAGIPNLEIILSNGNGYVVGDLLEIKSNDDTPVGEGVYIIVTDTQSKGVRSGTIVPGYRGTNHVTTFELMTGTCTKIGSTKTFPPIKFIARKLTLPSSISSITIKQVDTLGSSRYPSPTLISHKPHARVKVGSVDSLGSILTLVVESPGYGYSSLPTIKAPNGTRGVGASLFAVSLGVSRVEFTGAPLSVITSDDIVVTGTGILGTLRKRPATAIAQLAGDLNNISVDAVKNPNILETLELLKPGSTTGYAQAKPNMGVSSVTVVDQGRGYPMSVTSANEDITYVEVTEPDLPGGVKPTFDIRFNQTLNNGAIESIEVLSSGSGYSKFPKAMIKTRIDTTITVPAAVTLNMKLINGYVTSGGEGYIAPPTVSVLPPDLVSGGSQPNLQATMKTSINGFTIESTGSQYIEPPQALVVGPGNGASARAIMGVNDIYVTNGGSGYSIGDMLVFSAPETVTGDPANATVLEVSATGAIIRVGFVRSEIDPGSTNKAVLLAKNNDFIINGGSGYTTLPTITSIVTPSVVTGGLYESEAPNPLLTPSSGTGATFSTRLAVKNLEFISGGTEYESDASIIIQSPPSSQAANYSAAINVVGQMTSYVKNAAGSGYTRPPAVAINGNGTGASVTPIMGVTEVYIEKSGRGYSVGDIVTFAGGNPTEPANGVVTVIDRGGSGIGYNLTLTVAEHFDESTLTVDPTSGKLEGIAGGIKQSLIVEGGYDFELGDIISILPETRVPSQDALNSIRSTLRDTTITAGKLTNINLYSLDLSNDFKAGMILKVTAKDKTALPDAIAYIRINVVNDDIEGTGWHSVNNEYAADGVTLISRGSRIAGPGAKYGRLVPGISYAYDKVWASIGYEGISGFQVTVLASNAEWGTDTVVISNDGATYSDQKLEFEVVTQNEVEYPGSTAYFRVSQVLSSVGGIIQLTPYDPAAPTTTPTTTGKFYSVFDLNNYTGVPRGRISFIQILNPGSGYQSNPTAVISGTSGKPADDQAKVTTTLGVISLRIDSSGRGYTTNPVISIASPFHRSLTAQGYARSGVFDIDEIDSFEIVDRGAGYTGKFRDNSNALIDGGRYRLVGGALHQTGGSALSIDTELIIGPGAFDSSGLLKTSLNDIRTAAETLIRGSNYRIDDLVSIMPTGSTTSGNQAKPAILRIKKISKILDVNNGLSTNAQYNTGAGILDYAKRENDEDVGGYGAGYLVPPTVLILGGNQGVTLATSLGLVAADFMPNPDQNNNRGTNYQVGDLVQMISPEFSDPNNIGVVSRVDASGALLGVTIYEPYSKGLNQIPTLSIKRINPAFRITGYPVNQEANITAVLGVTVATTTTSSDGFIGRPYVFVEPPNGIGYIQQPTSARITPVLVNEVSAVNVYWSLDEGEYTTTLPLITIAPPPTIEKYSGWRSVRFNKEDSFEAIVQYTIAKAVSFQVDPDATLPGYYFTASAITIGGVVIPLRQSGGKGMQGRELSANRIIRRYKIKLIAV
jgi:hypothetical protein